MSAASPRQPDIEKYTSVRCDCGETCGAYLKRLERVRCDCGRMYMCLQPRRGGGFILRPWFPHVWQWPGFEDLKPRLVNPIQL